MRWGREFLLILQKKDLILLKGVRFKTIRGIALWPFVLLKDTNPAPVLVNHERIHLRQQIELLIIFFYLIYLGEWLWNFLVYRDFWKAYLQISFEKEAYCNEGDLHYLKHRKLFSWFKYLG